MQIYSLFFTQWNKVYIKLNYFACSVGRHQQAESFFARFRITPFSTFVAVSGYLNSLALHRRP